MTKNSYLWLPFEYYLRKNSCHNKNYILKNSKLHNFLSSAEWQHLHLSSMLVSQCHEYARKQHQFSANIVDSNAFIYSIGNYLGEEIQAFLFWTEEERLLFDCRKLREESWNFDKNILPGFILQGLKRLLSKYNTRQFIGTYRHYQFLCSHCEWTFQPQHYWIMVRKKNQQKLQSQSLEQQSMPIDKTNLYSLSHDLKLLRLETKHFQQLLTLELAYYSEEITQNKILNPLLKQVLEKNCGKRLEQYLQYGIFAKNELLARAMINRYGLNYWQIGGIYTVPRWRRQGLANILLHKLCQTIEKAGRQSMLFVRIENNAAINLYRKNSFEQLERMVIAQNTTAE